MLLLADATGFVRAAASAIAREAGIPADVARRALELFSSPDDESRTPDNQGKRIEKVDGGYRVLNYEKYRERDYTAAERMRRKRERDRVTRNGCNKTVTLRKQKQKHNKDIGANGSRPTVEDWLKELESDQTYTGINIREQYGKMLRWCEVNKKQPTQRRFVNWLNRADKPLPKTHAARVDYKRSYPTAARLPGDEELQRMREIAKREKEKLRESLNETR